MNNIQIVNIRPNNNSTTSDNNSEGAYISYNIILAGIDHHINGNFLASSKEVNNASTNHENWDGYKQLVLNRVQSDLKVLNTK